MVFHGADTQVYFFHFKQALNRRFSSQKTDLNLIRFWDTNDMCRMTIAAYAACAFFRFNDFNYLFLIFFNTPPTIWTSWSPSGALTPSFQIWWTGSLNNTRRGNLRSKVQWNYITAVWRTDLIPCQYSRTDKTIYTAAWAVNAPSLSAYFKLSKKKVDPESLFPFLSQPSLLPKDPRLRPMFTTRRAPSAISSAS